MSTPPLPVKVTEINYLELLRARVNSIAPTDHGYQYHGFSGVELVLYTPPGTPNLVVPVAAAVEMRSDGRMHLVDDQVRLEPYVAAP